MKKSILFIWLVIFFQFEVSSQSCLQDGITFATQNQIDNFQLNYPNCSHIEGSVIIAGDDINNLLGLNILDSIGGSLTIGGYYFSNPHLTRITGLESITFIGGDLKVVETATLNNLTGFTSVQEIGGSLVINSNHSLKNIASLNNLTLVGEDVRIQSNYAMNYLEGLNGLLHIEGTLEFYRNTNLINLSGIENITHIGGNLSLNHNHVLENLDALKNLVSINGGLGIAYNHGLTNLIGLENLTSIGGPLHIKFNNGLTSLEGISNIASWSIDPLYIFDNPLLTTCEVQSVCEFLVNPHGNCIIEDNASGCNSIEEVEYACLTIGLQETNTKPEFSIYPNPNSKLLFISSKDGVHPKEVIIFDQLGNKAILSEYTQAGIDVSKLPPGFYIVEIITNNYSIKGKLIKQ